MADTIMLKTSGANVEEEGIIGSAGIYPGMAVELALDGAFDKLQTASAGALKGGLKVAKEDGLQGNTVDDVYGGAGEVVFYAQPKAGDIVNLLIKTGLTIVEGDDIVVEAGGSGLFIKAAGTETKFQAEAIEGSGGALGANTLIACRILN